MWKKCALFEAVDTVDSQRLPPPKSVFDLAGGQAIHLPLQVQGLEGGTPRIFFGETTFFFKKRWIKGK